MSGRARRRGCLSGLLVALVVLGLAVGAVVVALQVLGGEDPPSNSCVAPIGEDVMVLDAEQADNAALMAAVAMRRELPAHAVTVAIATAMQESRLRNIDYGDRDSVGLFQQRPSQGWGTVAEIMDPIYSTNAFYDVLVTVQGWEDRPVTEAAQDVQRSAFPDAYAQHENRGRAFASALTGYSSSALVCELDPAEGGEASGTASAPGALGAVRDRLVRDFVEIGFQERGELLVVDATTLPAGRDAAPERRGWAVAQWAVATAGATGISTVVTDSEAWIRGDGDAAWVPLADAELPAAVAEAAAAAGPGAVVIA
ncbi:hypothetical protein GCM10023169_15010 [Georgenia halophila]|uniref:Uncharacterized protein n=1 Tax=Georgenia halophila TaxID=620889 RepID=A0ABP8L336_9MICO